MAVDVSIFPAKLIGKFQTMIFALFDVHLAKYKHAVIK